MPTFVTAVVDTERSNWSPYVRLVEYPNGNDIPDDHFFWWDEGDRNPDRIFNGNHREPYNASCITDNILIFEPPDQIRVYESITINAGFNEYSQEGKMISAKPA